MIGDSSKIQYRNPLWLSQAVSSPRTALPIEPDGFCQVPVSEGFLVNGLVTLDDYHRHSHPTAFFHIAKDFLLYCQTLLSQYFITS